ncbi:MAG: hypothetical protein IKT81_02660 [Clostridia bacterium]|nr:hypothetical protein [Clostridia bacterium]MBR4956050.1 hypothetical protein [Clostridia bacterium]MBR5902669.1 hypothetical protein [Clostridia bacterium]
MPAIDKNPPQQTGKTQTDLTNILNYLSYLREQINFAVDTLEKSTEE